VATAATPSRPAPPPDLGARPGRPGPGRRGAELLLYAGLIALSFALVAAVVQRGAGPVLAGAAIAGLSAWMFVSTHYERTLAVLALYLGLADGYVKLKLNSDVASLGRDALLYAITAGAALRLWIRREPVTLPPLSGWIVAFAAIVGAELLNPENGSWSHRLYGVRPHVEFLPLFFFGYAVMRSERRLKGMAVLLLAIAAANGVANLAQVNLTPEQFASWGPGYRAKVFGAAATGADAAGAVSSRTFKDASGVKRVRPFGLGGDFGFGGFMAVIALPAALALLLRERRPWRLALYALGALLAISAVITAQARLGIIEALVAVLAFGALVAASRRAVTAVVTLAIVVGATYLVIAALGGTQSTAFDRYQTIAPSSIVSTSTNRASVVDKLPDYIARFPLGAGLGTVGPARLYGGGPSHRDLSGESEFTFLVIEVGVVGLLVLLGFQLRLLWLSLRVRRLRPETTRVLMSALCAPLFAISASWFVGAATVNPPPAPFVYFVAGMLAWWVITRPRAQAAARRAVAAPA